LPEHLARERVVYPAPQACPCCGGVLHKLGEDVTEMLELVPAPVEGHPARAGEVLLPQLREDHSAAGGRRIDRARPGRPGLLAHVRSASTGASAADRQSTDLCP